MPTVENTTPISNNQTVTVGDGLAGFTDTGTSLPTTFMNGDALTVVGDDPEGFGRLFVSGTTTLSGLALRDLQTLLIQGAPLELQTGGTFGAAGQALIFTNGVTATGPVSFRAFANFDGAAAFVDGITLNEGGGAFFSGTFDEIVGEIGTRLLFGGATVNGTVRAIGLFDAESTVEVIAGGVLSAPVELVGRAFLLVEGTFNGSSVDGTQGSIGVTVSTGGLLESDLNLGKGLDRVDVQGDLNGTVRLGAGHDDLILDAPEARLEGNVFGQGGGDTLRVSAGVLDGRVNMGKGEDSVIVQADGAILGRVDTGLDNDRLENEGVIAGRVVMGGGNDVVSGNGTFADQVALGTGDDTANTGDGNDSIHGGAGNDIITTGRGDDLLNGGSGNDFLRGGRGADTLIGGPGTDTLIGGSGADVFQFSPNASDPNLPDVIRDFDQGEDVMDFGPGVNAFIGTSPFSGTPGEIRVQIFPDQTRVQVDYDGDGRADISVKLQDPINLTFEDFGLLSN